MAFDKERAVEILGEQVDTYEEMLKDHVTEGSEATAEDFLKVRAGLEYDRATIVGLREYVEEEYDCS